MTHDELLAKFDDLFPYDDKGHALRAVVELHKPWESVEGKFYCWGCAGDFKSYPCLTIQTIEKELV